MAHLDMTQLEQPSLPGPLQDLSGIPKLGLFFCMTSKGRFESLSNLTECLYLNGNSGQKMESVRILANMLLCAFVLYKHNECKKSLLIRTKERPCWIRPKAHLVQNSVFHSGSPAVSRKCASRRQRHTSVLPLCSCN